MRLPPRALLKRLLRAHLPPGVRLSAQTDVLVYLAYLLFLQRLAGEARVRMQLDAAAGVPGARRTMAQRHVREARRRVRG
jgi:hypothetical protein